MKTYQTFSIVGIALLMLAGCAPAPAEIESAPVSDFRPTSTIKDIMLSVVDPSADAIWESVATVVDFEGIHEEFPETDEEWVAVRIEAIRIIEGSNMLLVPGRDVAEPGANSEFPGIELEPEEVQELIEQDWAAWTEFAHGLHDMATITLAAIDARDTEALLASGEGLDVACERCHLNYRYPNDAAARELFEDNERLRQEFDVIDGEIQ